MPLPSGIIAYFGAIFIQLNRSSAAIFKTMQMDTYAVAVKGFNFIKDIHDAAVVYGIGDIHTNDMKMFFWHLFN
jgi:hypothetical protein